MKTRYANYERDPVTGASRESQYSIWNPDRREEQNFLSRANYSLEKRYSGNDLEYEKWKMRVALRKDSGMTVNEILRLDGRI